MQVCVRAKYIARGRRERALGQGRAPPGTTGAGQGRAHSTQPRGSMAALADKVQKIKHELGLDASLSEAAALQSANEIMGLRPSNYTLPEQADLLLNVRCRPAPATEAHGPSPMRVP